MMLLNMFPKEFMMNYLNIKGKSLIYDTVSSCHLYFQDTHDDVRIFEQIGILYFLDSGGTLHDSYLRSFGLHIYDSPTVSKLVLEALESPSFEAIFPDHFQPCSCEEYAYLNQHKEDFNVVVEKHDCPSPRSRLEGHFQPYLMTFITSFIEYLEK